MPNTNAVQVGPMDPLARLNQDYFVKTLQAQRQQRLADALMQQGMAPIDYDPHGRISPWQGASKMLSAYLSGYMGNKAIDAMAGANKAGTDVKAAMFGLRQSVPTQPSDQPAAGLPNAAASPQPTSGPSPSQLALALGAKGGSVGPTLSNASLADSLPQSTIPQNSAADLANADSGHMSAVMSGGQSPAAGPTPQASPSSFMVMPGYPPGGPQPVQAPSVLPGSAPVSSLVIPGMTPQQAFMAYQADPEGYMKELVSRTDNRTDFSKSLLSMGIDPHSPTGQQMMGSWVKKQTYIEPTAIRPGGAIRDPQTGAITTTPSAAPEGFQNVQLSDGSWRTIPVTGGTQATEAARGASARGDLQGHLVEVTNPDNSKTMVPGSAFLGGGTRGQQLGTSATQGGVNPGRFGAWSPSGVNGNLVTSLPPGKTEAQKTMATDNVGLYRTTREAASTSADRVNTLDHMLALSQSGTNFGMGTTEGMAHRAKVNATLSAMGLPTLGSDNNANAQVMQKLTSILTQQQMKALGGTGTDKQLDMVLHGVPNPDMMNSAMGKVIPLLKANELAIQAKANATDQWLANNGNDASKLNQFEAAWRQNYDPRVYQMSLMSPQERRQFTAGLNQTERTQLATKVKTAAQNGWIQ